MLYTQIYSYPVRPLMALNRYVVTAVVAGRY